LTNRKIDITKYIATQEGLSLEDPYLRRLLSAWWQNPRLKEVGGLRLTEQGFEIMSKHFKSHMVRFEEELKLKFSNQLVLRLDKFITCPWYITHRAVWVFDDKMAIQLVLFSGNIEKFTTAKAKSLDRSQD
jgi:hypothetical protein